MIPNTMKSIYQNTAAIILAGGKSLRAETTKGLRIYNHDYWLDIQIKFFKSQGINNVIVGLGFDSANYITHSKQLSRCKNAINPNPQHGSFSTLQQSMTTALKQEWDRLIVIHIDHALPKVTTIEKLLESRKYDVVKPHYNNKSGHPIILSRAFCKNIIQMPYSTQLNIEIQKLKREQILWAQVDDQNIHENLNTKENWQDYKRTLNNS